MIYHWILFSLLFIGIPFFVVYTRRSVLKTAQLELTPEMEEQSQFRAFIYILYLWLIDLFYMSCFIDNMVCKYVFGGFIMLTIFMNLAGAFSQPKRRNSIELWSMLIDFIIGIGLTIYLIYIIPNDNLREIATPIIASVYCGLLTLLGVTLTIRKSDFDRKEDEVKKSRPLVFIADSNETEYLNSNHTCKWLLSNQQKGNLKKSENENNYYIIKQIFIYNSDYSYSSLWGFKINDSVHLFDVGQVIPKNCLMKFNSDFKFEYSKQIDNISLLIKDMMDIIYEFDVEFVIKKNGDKKEIEIISGFEIKKSSLKYE